MKKILIINTIALNYEGITTVIDNYVSHMDRTGLQLEFIGHRETPPALLAHFEKIGRVHITPIRKTDLKGYIPALFKILRRRYDVVHIHGNSATMAIEAVLAKLCGAKKVIVHQHSTSCMHDTANRVLKPVMFLCTDEVLACSKAAGRFLCGNRRFTVLNNAIAPDAFAFDETVRQEVRASFGIGDEPLIGHIGLFSVWKNQSFLLDAFAALLKQRPDAKLMLVGDGPLFAEMKAKAASFGIADRVLFPGRRSDAARLYQALDLFVVPSLWEGLSLVSLEAQAAGLPVLASDTLPPDAKCTDRMVYKSLSDGPESWAAEMLRLLDLQVDRNADVASAIRSHGFDITEEAEKLRRLYLK